MEEISIKSIYQYLDYLVDPSFQGINRLFVLSFQNNVVRVGHTRHFLPKVETKDYNVRIYGKKICWSTSKD